MDGGNDSASAATGLRIVVRLLDDKDSNNGSDSPSARLIAQEQTAVVELHSDKLGLENFGFDGVLGPASTPEDLLNSCRPTVEHFLGGADGLIISCDLSSSRDSSSPTDSCLILREESNDPLHFLTLCLKDIFNKLEKRAKDNSGNQNTVSVQFLEVSDDAAYDLVVDVGRSHPLSIDHGNLRALGLSETQVTSADDIIDLVSAASSSGKPSSSRNLSILVLRLIVQSGSGEEQNRSALTLCDLNRLSSTDRENSDKGCGTSWDVVERCLLGINHPGKIGFTATETYLNRAVQETLSSHGLGNLILSLNQRSEHAVETRKVMEAASLARQIQRPFIPMELSDGMSLQEALEEIHSLRTQLRSASIVAPSRSSRTSECASCHSLRERMRRLERDNEELRARCRESELELGLLRKEKALHSNPPEPDVRGLKMTNTQELLSPYRRPAHRSNACAKHDLTDCVLCQLQFPSLDHSDMTRKVAPLPSISEPPRVKSDAPEVKMDPHGTPLALSNRYCSAHRVSNCLLCDSRSNSLGVGLLNPLEHSTKVDAMAISTFSIQPALATSTESEQRTGPRYRYSEVEEDLMSEVKMTSTANTIGKSHRMKKDESKAGNSSAIDAVLAPYLPALKTKKKARRSSGHRKRP